MGRHRTAIRLGQPLGLHVGAPIGRRNERSEDPQRHVQPVIGEPVEVEARIATVVDHLEQDVVRPRPVVSYYKRFSAIWQKGVREILFENGSPEKVASNMQFEIDRLKSRSLKK